MNGNWSKQSLEDYLFKQKVIFCGHTPILACENKLIIKSSFPIVNENFKLLLFFLSDAARPDFGGKLLGMAKEFFFK